MKKLIILFVLVLSVGCANYRYLTKEYKFGKKEAVRKDLPIIIMNVKVSEPDYAGGVDVNVVYENISDKEMKYIVFHVVPYNAVGDIVKCDITGHSKIKLEVTGPVLIKEYTDGYFGTAWYNHSIKSAKLLKVDITYMDGSKVTEDRINAITIDIDESDYFDLQD